MYDLIITGGRVLDGTGNPWQWADLGIRHGCIAALVPARPGQPSPLAGKAPRVIDATGQVVAPGFIDLHSHSDLPLLANRTADSKVMQGVTTEVIGQCGASLAPVTEASLPVLRAAMRGFLEVETEWPWRSYGDYLGRLASQGTSVNVAGVVGHGPVRIAAMGFEQRPPTAGELELMGAMIRRSIEEGAFGWSTGLIYTPGSYSQLDELEALGRATGEAGGIYFTHMRSEGEGIFGALAEALAVGRAGRCPVHVSHLKASGGAQGRAPELLAALEAARAEGIDVTADQYPYIAGSTSLAALLPPWAHQGGREQLLARLRDPAGRERMAADMRGKLPGWENDFRGLPWDKVVISRCEAQPTYEGRSVASIAAELGRDGYDTVFHLLAEVDPGTGMVVFMMREDEVALMMRHDLVMVGTDGSGLCPTGPMGQGKPHPRSYGTFPRILGQYVREQGSLTLQQAIRKMTSAAAGRLGLADRGQLREGWWADVVVFDPATVADRATFADPHQYPAGIGHVLVNGQVVVEGGRHTGRTPGQVLRPRSRQGGTD